MTNLFLIIGAVLAGLLLGNWLKKGTPSFKFFLTFSGAFLLSVNLLELFPSQFKEQGELAGIWILAGVAVQILLEFLTRGMEHGHGHMLHRPAAAYSLVLGIFIHAFFEGLPLQNDEHQHLALAVALHKTPIALLLWVLLKDYFKKVWPAIGIMVLFGMATPIGYWIGGYLQIDKGHALSGILAGIFLHISTVILFESSEGHRFNLRKLLAVFLGFILGILSVMMH